MEEQVRAALPEQYAPDRALREEVARLRASLTALVLQKDELLLVQCRRTENAYLRRFGSLELRVYETYCECLRAKRRAKLIRADRNRRSRVDLNQVEQTLETEFEEYRRELDQKFQRVAGAMERREGPGLSQQGTRELKDRYRFLVKALHPDLHPEEPEEKSRTLQQAMRAYRAGDLDTLRTLCDTLEPPEAQQPETLQALEAEAARLRGEIKAQNRLLEKIKGDYPMKMRVYLEDEEKAKAREQELQAQLQDLRDRISRYETAVEEMLRAEQEELE